MDHNKSMIQFHLSNVKKKVTQKNILFVFKGFDQSFYNELTIEKLLSCSTEVSIQQLADSRAYLYPEVFSRISSAQKSVFWVTIEEFITLGRDILSLYFEIIMLKNNLYHQTFPILYPIDNIDEIYQRYYHDDEWPDNLSAELEILQTYYGDIKKVDNQYYVTYITETNDLDFYVFENVDQLPEDVQSVYEEAYLELTEEEDQILLFIHDVTQGKINGKVVHITYSGKLNSFPNYYYNRLTLLQYLYKEQVQLILSTKKLETKRVYEEEYLKILKKYWGYDSFRMLKMYKNINEPANKARSVLV
jgi:ATP-dependent DNA helicase RecQ